jgi:diguanylate cyclase (GGDEF)-like protein/PAS domain S-box-containing protein
VPESQKHLSAQKKFLRYFVIRFFLAVLVFIVGVALPVHVSDLRQINKIKAGHAQDSRFISHLISKSVSDSIYQFKEYQAHLLAELESRENTPAVTPWLSKLTEHQLRLFCDNSRYFERFSIVDADGAPLIRLSKEEGGSCQSAKRDEISYDPFLSQLIRNSREANDAITLSAVRLQREGNALVEPLKPVLKMIMPLDSDSSIFLSADYLWGVIIPVLDEAFKEHSNELIHHHYILNAQGGFVYSSDTSISAFEFDLVDVPQFPIKKSEVWRGIQNKLTYIESGESAYFIEYFKSVNDYTDQFGLKLSDSSPTTGYYVSELPKHSIYDGTLSYGQGRWLALVSALVVLVLISSLWSKLAIRKERLQSNQARLRALMNQSPDAVCIFKAETGEVVDWSTQFEKIYGYKSTEVGRLTIFDIDEGVMSLTQWQALVKKSSISGVSHLERIHTRKDRSTFTAGISAVLLNLNGVLYVSANIRDVTEQRLLQKELDETILALETAERMGRNGSFEFVLGSEFMRWSEGLYVLTGYTRGEVDLNINFVLDSIIDREVLKVFVAWMRKGIRREKRNMGSLETKLVRKDGRSIDVLVHARLVFTDGVPTSIFGTCVDIEDQKQVVEMLENKAATDHLTGLFNRVKISEFFDHELDRLEREQSSLSVLLIDVDLFKSVNDTYGHLVGDDVLKRVSSIIKNQIRKSDLAARYGGEEFLVICPDTNLDGALQLAEKLRALIESTEFNDVGCVTISLGATEYHDGDTPDTMLKRVDKALYNAKESGRNRVESL